MADDKKIKDSSGDNWLILGGCGFIGRNLVKYLVDNNLGQVKICDKSIPATSYLNPEHKKAFDSDNVEFKQADLSRKAHVEERAFKDFNPTYVINLCGETRFGCIEEEYNKKSFEPAVLCAEVAAKHGVKKFVEVSTAQIYNPDKKMHNEEAKIKPWTRQAIVRLKAEEAVCKVDKLPWVVLRPSIVYGPGDLTGIMPRVTCAAVYQSLNEKMKFLWAKDLKINCVHVDDMCAAICLAATEIDAGSKFNLSDQTDLDQGKLNTYLSELFEIKTGFMGSIVSNLAKMKLNDVAAHSNDKHVPGWSTLCQKHGILNTPLSPYIDKELLYNNHFGVDGTGITKKTKFKYTHPKMTKELLQATIQSFIDQKVFPPVMKG